MSPESPRERELWGRHLISDLTISRISSVLFSRQGVALEELIAELKVSRNTAMKWLALMRAEGYLSRGSAPTGLRGRPRWIYRPTEKLRARVVSFESNSLAMLSFAALREACKYLMGNECTLEPRTCNISVCPLVNL